MDKKTILFVDDEINILNALKKLFFKENYNLLLTNNPFEALKMIDEQHIDAIVSDYKMPEMTGCELLTQVKEKKPEITRIILTGYADITFIMSAINDGSIDKYFLKPWDNQTLREEIKKSINEKTKTINYLSDMITRDPVTNLIGIRQFQKEMDHVMFEQDDVKNFYLVVISVDKLTFLIDSFGVDVGHKILKFVANMLIECLPKDTLLAKYNTNTFAFVIKNSSTSFVESLLDIIQDKTKDFNSQTYNEFILKLYAGISFYPDDAKSLEELIFKAESAQKYISVDSVGVAKFFSQKPSQAYNNHLFKLEKELFQAIENHEIELHLQPIYDVNKQTMNSAEILCRWPNPKHGMVTPDIFIPISESTGSIIPLSKLILHEGCMILKQLSQKYDPNFRLSINVSPQYLFSQNFVLDLSVAIATSGINPHCLQLELTENLFVDFSTQILDRLTSLRGEGIKIALDDFGTGYASFNYLKNFPVDVLKIDKVFISDLPQASSTSLVTAIIIMAHALGIQVVAEGVEQKAQLDVLTDLNCDYIQGFYFSKPMRQSEFELYLDQWQDRQSNIK